MNRVHALLCSAALTGAVAWSPIASADSAAEIEEAQRLFREHCRHCHDDGSENGYYTPMSLIQAQWERFFDRKFERKHRKVIDDKFGGVPVTEAISPEDLEKIREFAIDHAADTDQPMTCG
jgi:cytochrome c5